jgi:predicted transcriptional regulator
MDEQTQRKNNLALVSDIVSSYLRRNIVRVDEIGRVVSTVTTAMRDAEWTIDGGSAGREAEQALTEKKEPAISVRGSIRPEYLVCLDCGAKVKTLKRHLQSAHSMSPAQYREAWGLKSDYPMTAPAYSEQRSAMAKSLGLGRKPGQKPPARKGGRRKAALKNGSGTPASE